MKKILYPALVSLLLPLSVRAQDAESAVETPTSTPLEISGSVDFYYKYDFAKTANIETSFANENNSLSIGMIAVALSKTVGKASFTGELSFGPRGQFQSIPVDADGNSFHIQNLYASYQFTDKFSMTAGYMGTFVGYEVISPTGNFNYSTSRLFTNGPFQNAGVKAEYAFSDRVSLMVGLFNDWNVYQDFDGLSDLGAQLHLVPTEGWDVYANLISGKTAYGYGTQLDLTTGIQMGDAFYLGLNAANLSLSEGASSEMGTTGFAGVALYPQLTLSETLGLGLRYEYFKWKDQGEGSNLNVNEAYNAVTLSGNIKLGPLTVIPEFRLDAADQDVFFNAQGAPVGSASQALVGVVYGF